MDNVRFVIQNKKLILRPENQPKCRKLTFHCGYYERARYLLNLITAAHIFDFNQLRMFPPSKHESNQQINHRELSVDKRVQNQIQPIEIENRIQYESDDEDDDGFYVDVTDIQIKKSNPAVRTLSVSGPIRVPKHNHIHGAYY